MRPKSVHALSSFAVAAKPLSTVSKAYLIHAYDGSRRYADTSSRPLGAAT